MENLIKFTLFVIIPLLVAGVLISSLMFVRERVLAMPKPKFRKHTKKEFVLEVLALICLVVLICVEIATR